MSTVASSLPLLEYLGVGILQKAVDSALGPNVLTIGADAGGLSLGVHLSGGQTIQFDDVAAGAPGLSGRLFIDGLSAANPLQATLFDGFVIGLTAFDVALANGGLSRSHVAGQFQVPFFTDSAGNPRTLDIELGFKADGSLSVTLAATQSATPTTADGLVQLQYSIGGGAVTIELDVAAFELDQLPDGTYRAVISGRLLVSTADLQWPSFELRGLGIDSQGHISIDGGWIDLPNQTALDFYGFHVALQKLGFGSDSSGRWIGFNGDIHLVEGLSLGGSVRGLRINLDSGAVSFDGVGIDFSIPDVMSITGEIDHVHVDANSADDLTRAGLLPTLFDQIDNGPGNPPLPKKVDVFAGQVDVRISVAAGLEIDGRFIVGHFGGTSVFFLALDAELPVGIPIFLDVSLYGIQGLVASNLEPHPEPNHTWWEWYKYPTDAGGIDTGAAPDYDATAVSKWLAPKSGALALGAGATIGTSVDDGFTVSAAIAFVLMLPGPIITLIGKANILSKRIGGANQDANFNALAVYDGNSQTFDITIDAHYQIPVVLEIDGTGELHVSPGEDPSWFFALGRPPHEKRLKARVFDLFETDAYFVVSDLGLLTGTWSGYRGSWSFGPLSVSLDAYTATLAAIQWSPLQIAGGIELHGDVHLDAFGIGLGITADALIEGCAPNPFWVHGEFHVELDLPWPLPDPSATISLSWGGDDGDTPPAPLALSHLDANLADHKDDSGKPSSDHYVLLAHRAGGPWPDSLHYDAPNKPGLLAPDAAADAAWHARTDGFDPGQPEDLRKILPDLDPSGALAGRYAPLVPQDAHFVLTFAHPVHDGAGFEQATSPPDEILTVQPPSIVDKDDMSNINPQPPSVQWEYRHTLAQVAIFQYMSSAWQLVCAIPEIAGQPLGPTRLKGIWMTPPNADPTRQAQMQLRVFPYRMLPGEPASASWGTVGSVRTLGTQFTDQGLQFVLDSGFLPAADGAAFIMVSQKGLAMTLPRGAGGDGRVHVRFPLAVQLTSIVSLILIQDGEIVSYEAPLWSGDGTTLALASSTQQGEEWVQAFPDNTPAIRELSTLLGPGDTLFLYTVDYRLPDIGMAILPDAPALYAIQTVTRLESGRVNNGSVAFNDVRDGNPIVEFSYMQTASGPGTAIVGDPVPPTPPSPVESAPYPVLNGQQSRASFPQGGALVDLDSYAQWSWPPDGSPAAYFGYDVNVEFVETYVNALYTDFSGKIVQDSLHFRCVDRNQRHAPLQPVAIHVPSIYQQSALVAEPTTLPLPDPIALPAQPPVHIVPQALSMLSERAQLAADLPDRPPTAGLVAPSPDVTLAASRLAVPTSAAYARQVTPKVAVDLLKLLQEQADAATARALWFHPLAPQTRYTVDVVAGPFAAREHSTLASLSAAGSLTAIYSAGDASGVLAALRAYYSHEDALTPLLRTQFTTSRYATFTAQMANVAAQIGKVAGVAPLRHYVAAVDPRTWLTGPSSPDVPRLLNPGPYSNYLQARDDLATVVGSFDPFADNLRADGSPAASGAGALVAKRQAVGQSWAAFSGATTAVFDALIAALGRPDLKSNAAAPLPAPVPATELSLFTDAPNHHVYALLLESPEPLEWRRLWRWIQLTSDETSSSVTSETGVFWNADGTRGLLVIQGEPLTTPYRLTLTFQGNIGAESPCITSNGDPVWEFVDLGQLQLQTAPIRRPKPPAPRSTPVTPRRRPGGSG